MVQPVPITHDDEPRNAFPADGRTSPIGWVMAIVVLLLGALLAAGLWMTSGNEAPTGVVTVGAVAGDPGPYIGRTVVIAGRVDELLTPNTLALTSEETSARLLVVSPMPLPRIAPGDVVQTLGTVRAFDAARFRNEFPAVAAPDGDALASDGAPVVVADDVALVAAGR